MVDPPCSALGLRPRLTIKITKQVLIVMLLNETLYKLTQQEQEMEHHAVHQRNFLRAAMMLLKVTRPESCLDDRTLWRV